MTAVRVSGARLERELAKRGWDAVDLARVAGVSSATLSAAMNGKPISSRSLQKIAIAIARTPAVPGLEELLETATTPAAPPSASA